MAVNIGYKQFPEFDVRNDPETVYARFSKYAKRFKDNHLKAYNITEKHQQRSLFLDSIGKATLDIFEQLDDTGTDLDGAITALLNKKPFCKQEIKFAQRGEQTTDTSPGSSDEDSTCTLQEVNPVGQSDNRPLKTVPISGVDITVLPDSGAMVNAMDEATFKKYGLNKRVNIRKSRCQIKSHGAASKANTLPVLGCFEALTESKTKMKVITRQLIKGDTRTEPLLGYNVASDLGMILVTNSIATESNQSEGTDNLNEVLEKYEDWFQGIGKLKGIQVDLNVDPDLKPVAQPPRRQSFSVRQKMEEEIKHLIDQDIIEKVNQPTGCLTKTARIASLEGKPVRNEVNRGIRAYRATEHATTGVSPKRLMFGRESRGKFPEVKGQPKNKDDTMIRCRDREQKQKMNQYAGKRRHTAVMKIKVGDTVLCKQERKNSLTPLYDPDPMVVIGVKGSMITAKNSVRIRTRNYAESDWKLLKNGCGESPPCDDCDSDDAFEPEEVIIEGPEQSLAGSSGDTVPADRSSESRQDHEHPRANIDTVEYDSRQRSGKSGSDRDTQQRQAPSGRPRRKISSTIKTLFANSEHLLVYYIRACK